MTDELQQAVDALIRLEHCFTEPEFICRVEELLTANLPLFASSEGTHQNFEVFQEYCGIVEARLEQFVAESHMDQQELLNHCDTIFSQDPYALTCFEYIVSALRYEDFLEMMLNRQQLGEWEEEQKEAG